MNQLREQLLDLFYEENVMCDVSIEDLVGFVVDIIEENVVYVKMNKV